jgi:glycosyltransferase involved in cell wall biosynthesis
VGLGADPPVGLTVRILHLTPELPYEPGGGGGRTREFFLCKRLADLGHAVLNISPAFRHELPLADSLRAVGVENWVARRPATPREEVARAVAAEPAVLSAAVTRPVRALEMRVFWTRLRPLAERAVREFRPDVVLVGHDMAAAWACDLPRELPAALTLHNLTWHWYLSRSRRAAGAEAFALRAEASRYRRHVLRVLPRFDAAIAVSTSEAEEVRALGVTRVALIPTGVDTELLRPAPEPPASPPRLLFTGTMSYPPNHQGILWFAEQVWPLVRRTRPDAELDVVGKDPPDAVRALHGRDGIAVHGFVPSMAPFFAGAHAVVVPILTGAGIRVKIVEAMSAGRALVSTALGWEGLAHVEPGRHLLVADEPDAFAAAALRLLDDAGLRARMAADARALAEREYDWRALGDRLERVLAEVSGAS